MYSLIVLLAISAPPQAPLPPQALPVREESPHHGPTRPPPPGEGWQWSNEEARWWRWRTVPAVASPAVFCAPPAVPVQPWQEHCHPSTFAPVRMPTFAPAPVFRGGFNGFRGGNGAANCGPRG